MSWNKKAAVKYAQLHAQGKSTHYCARFVCNAVNAGGIHLTCANAKDLGRHLADAGFYVTHGLLQAGDIAVIQGTQHHEYGHVCIFDGHQWISDFRQKTMYPGVEYRALKPSFIIYRHD